MIQVSGYAAQQAKAPLAPYAFERREPREHDIVIDIQYCGICHTDIHQVRNEWGASTFPMIPGHEIAGIVTGVGSKATRYQIGDRVAVGCFVDSCRKCGPCRQGLEQYCTEGPTLTYNSLERDGQTRTQGGYSDKIVVDEDYILRLADNVSLDRAAPLLCAGITMYSPLIHWNAGPGKKVGIIGLGGLGHMGVKIADALGSEVSVLSHSLKKQEDGLKMGADKFYATSDHETFKNLRGYFDLIINTLAIEIQWDDYLNLLDLNGTMVVVGIPEKQTPINPATLIMARRSLAGSVIGGIRETQEMLDFCSKHNISSDIEVTPIQKINEAYERVVKSDARYRFVIDMKSL
jgi:uncharacterized zinc-type alcohol dehydrogenase-like protein